MIRIVVKSRITDLGVVTTNHVTEIRVPKQITLLDCMLKTMGYSLCAAYLVSGEPRDDDIVSAAARRLVSDLSNDLSAFSEAHGLFRVSIKYPLYKNLYRLTSRAEIYKHLAIRYLENGSPDVDLAIGITARNAGFKIDGGWLSIDKEKGYLVNIRADWLKTIPAIESLKRSFDEYLNPLIKILKSVRIPQLEDPPPPEDLIECVEGKVIDYRSIRDRIYDSGVVRSDKTLPKILNALSTSRIVRDRESGVKMVMKNFSDYASAKWLLISPTVDLMTRVGIRPKALPRARFWNEYRYTIELRRLGIATQRILYIDPWSLTMIKEYIEGEPLSRYAIYGGMVDEAVEIFMRTIAKIHSSGVCLIDTKPDNFIAMEGSDTAYCIDLEQAGRCRRYSHMAWDLVVFPYFLLLIAPNNMANRIPLIIEDKIRIYLDSLKLGDKAKARILSSLSDPRITYIFLVGLSIIGPTKIKPLLDILKKLGSLKP
ncbi:MAG: hypothetical protein QXI22_04605 [Sulfolobales archaeon]